MADLLEGYSKWSDTHKVCLYYAAPCLIVPAKTGVIYYNQTDCVSCNHPEVEGFSLPVRPRHLEFLDGGFCSHYFYGSRGEREFEESIEELVASVGLNFKSFSFEEAWTTIQVNQGGGKYTDGTDFEVILSWENCD